LGCLFACHYLTSWEIFSQHVQIHTVAVLIGVPLFVALVALVSTYVPALRASKIDLVHALRCE